MKWLTLGLLSAFFGAALSASAEPGETIVYIQCGEEPNISRGSGVLVSDQGHVITAKHVVGDASTCRGSIGVADSGDTKRMILQRHGADHVDVELLRFAERGEYPFVGYCDVEDWMVRREIVVAGFPAATDTGSPSYRKGVLSTAVPDARGLIETDGQTIGGMSGGPVYSRSLNGIIGIVIGAEFDVDGEVEFYGILPTSFYAPDLNLMPAEKACYHQFPEKQFSNEDNVWKSDQEVPKDLGVSADEGMCFLEGVFGEFNNPADKVAVELIEKRYVITGENKAGSVHGGTARCIWHD